MSIQSVLKSTVIALAILTSATLFAQGTPINTAAFDALVAQGPVADSATIASSTWASKIKQAGALRLGATQTSNLFSLLNEKDGKIRGFDAGLAQLITRWSPGGVAGLESFSQRNLPDWTWSRVMAPMLMRPCWLMPVDFALIFAGIAATIAIRRARPAERKRG